MNHPRNRRSARARRAGSALIFLTTVLAGVAVASPAMADAPAASSSAVVSASISPAGGTVVGGTTVTISGPSLTAKSTVTFGGQKATYVHVVDRNTITVVAPPHTAGRVTVTVTTGRTSSDVGSFDYQSPRGWVVPLPASPSTGKISGGTTVTLSGGYFGGVRGVTFGGVPAKSFRVDDAGRLTAVAPAHAAGTVSVVVTGQWGDVAPSWIFVYGSSSK